MDTPRRRGRPVRGILQCIHDSPDAAFYVSFVMGLPAILPLFICKKPEDSAAIELTVAEQLGLPDAQKRGILETWVMTWKSGPYPKNIIRVRLIRRPGQPRWRNILGRTAYGNLHEVMQNLERPQGRYFPEE